MEGRTERQLALLEVEPDWRLDDHTRQVGRRGVEQARQALRRAHRSRHDDQLDDGRRHAA
jgi:hypothetical protein